MDRPERNSFSFLGRGLFSPLSSHLWYVQLVKLNGSRGLDLGSGGRWRRDGVYVWLARERQRGAAEQEQEPDDRSVCLYLKMSYNRVFWIYTPVLWVRRTYSVLL